VSGGWPAGVLRSRLLPPRLPTACLPRTALAARVRHGLSGRLVAVAAGAGYGKTTLLTLALQDAGLPWIWLACDERLSQPRLLLAHLAAGVGERFPGFGARLDLEGDAGDQVLAFSNEVVATIDEDFAIVVDDVHSLAGLQSERVLELLFRDLPPTAHLVMASRTELPFSLARARMGQLTEVGERDLALSEDETAELVHSAGHEATADQLADLHRRTEGWAAGLILALQSGPLLAGVDLDQPYVFDYMADEVLLRQPENVQRFLLSTSVLERFTPQIAEAVSGDAGAEEILQALVADRLFTLRLEEGGDWYRYHHLFQAFLRRRAGDRCDGAGLEELHGRAARAWSLAGEPVEAVRHLMEAGKLAEAVDAVEPVAERMATGPDAEILADWLDQLPQDLWFDRPGLVLAHAALQLTRGRYEESFSSFERAVERLLAIGDHERAAAALFRLLQAMVSSGTRPDRRIETGRAFLERLDPAARMLPAARIMQAAAYAYACRFEEAARELTAAERAPAVATWETLRVYASVIRAFYIDYQLSRSEDAVLVLEDAIADLERHEADDALGILAYARLFHVYLITDLGRFEDALTDAERTLEAARRRGIGRGMGRALSWARCMALAALDRWDDLARDLTPVGQSASRDEPTSYGYRMRAPAARLAARRGEAAEVRAHIGAARREMADYGTVSDAHMVLCDLALAARDVGLADLADELASEAQDAAATMNATRGLARSTLVRAAVTGDEQVADRLLTQALELTAQWALDGLWTRRDRPLAGPLLARALERRLGPTGVAAALAARCGGEVFAECARRLATAPREARVELARVAGDAAGVDADVVEELLRDRDTDVRTAAHLSQGRRTTRAPLVIASLGGLVVRRGDVVVPTSAFGRERARALLAALLCARRPVHREELLEWFWPDLPPDRGLRAFHVTLYALRRALEPELARRASSSIIVSEGETYRVALGAHDRWDAAEFLHRTRDAPARGADALADLLAAEAAYLGPLFPEWPYAEWASACRQDVEAARVTLLGRLAEHLGEAGQVFQAAERYETLLALEPEREAWHRALMGVYASAGERALALRQFHACRTMMRRELGIEPSAETRALYQAILTEGDELPTDGSTPTGADVQTLPEGTVTIMLADIAGSTALTERLGDAAFRSLARQLDRAMRGIVTETGGVSVEGRLLGDGLMAVFRSGRQAIDCATRTNAVASDIGLGLHVGLHAGDVVREGENVFGGAVNFAARVAALAAPGEVLVSETVRNLARTSAAVIFESRGSHTLKGMEGRHLLYAVRPRPVGQPGQPTGRGSQG
jgi:DNA-binding SARP family transcriptional activator